MTHDSAASPARLLAATVLLALLAAPARRLDLMFVDGLRALGPPPGPSTAITLLVADALSPEDERRLHDAGAREVRRAVADLPARGLFEGAVHRRLPGDSPGAGPRYIDWRGTIDSGGFFAYDLEDLRGGCIPRQALSGRTVLHGSRGTGAAELIATPIGLLTPLEYAANVLDGLARGSAIPALPLWLQALMAAAPLAGGAGLLAASVRGHGPGLSRRAMLAAAANCALLWLGVLLQTQLLLGLFACTAGWLAACALPTSSREARLERLLDDGRAAEVLREAAEGEEHLGLRAAIACGRFEEVEGLIARADLRRIPAALGMKLAEQLDAAGHAEPALVLLEWALASGGPSQEISRRAAELRGRQAGLKGLLGIEGISRLISGRYTRLEFLGQGGMGIVLRGWDTYLARTVALKVLNPALLGDATARGRFRREVETMMRLNHPNIVEIHSVHTDELLYFAMEFLEGRSAKEALSHDPASVDRMAVLRVVAGCMAHCHEQGMLHRDLKPDNVLILADGRVKLIDFGIARAMGETDLTAAGEVLGTLGYLAPELLQGGQPGPATDIFAFGVMAFELYAGRLPFAHPLAMGTILPPPGMPPPVSRLMLACMARQPSSRPDGFRAVAAMLDEEDSF